MQELLLVSFWGFFLPFRTEPGTCCFLWFLLCQAEQILKWDVYRPINPPPFTPRSVREVQTLLCLVPKPRWVSLCHKRDDDDDDVTHDDYSVPPGLCGQKTTDSLYEMVEARAICNHHLIIKSSSSSNSKSQNKASRSPKDTCWVFHEEHWQVRVHSSRWITVIHVGNE